MLSTGKYVFLAVQPARAVSCVPPKHVCKQAHEKTQEASLMYGRLPHGVGSMQPQGAVPLLPGQLSENSQGLQVYALMPFVFLQLCACTAPA